MSTRGLFIAIEGIDGAGTSSQTATLKQRLEARGHRIHLTAEPSSGPVGRLIRELLGQVHTPPDPAALALLFAADRVDHLRSEIEPALAQGIHVLSDRYVLSSLVYQSLENPLQWVQTINRHARPPDLTVLFTLDPATAAARRDSRGSAEEIYDRLETQQQLATRYAELARGLSGHPVERLDASPEFDAVADAYEQLVLTHLERDR